MYNSFEEQPVGSQSSTEFEVLVSEENLSFAQWILSWEEEMHQEQEADAKKLERNLREKKSHPMLQVFAPYVSQNLLRPALCVQIVEYPCVRRKEVLSNKIRERHCAIFCIRNFWLT
jgi:hypothetical protein